jgi:1-acyl-sn-glycerol-3-phosphate acyltransferase
MSRRLSLWGSVLPTGLQRQPQPDDRRGLDRCAYPRFRPTAVLPPRFGYTAMRELASAALLGAPLRRLSAVFVERADAARGVEDTGVLEAHARAGEPLVTFPEGIFRRAPGLLPFKLGAFVVAAHTGAPIIPVALAGTRCCAAAGGCRAAARS